MSKVEEKLIKTLSEIKPSAKNIGVRLGLLYVEDRFLYASSGIANLMDATRGKATAKDLERYCWPVIRACISLLKAHKEFAQYWNKFGTTVYFLPPKERPKGVLGGVIYCLRYSQKNKDLPDIGSCLMRAGSSIHSAKGRHINPGTDASDVAAYSIAQAAAAMLILPTKVKRG